ncbi:MAG: acetyl-CoA carboxylase biotin carboxyl carrier protein, partial [Cyclonatronaceae bacterium]
MDLKTIKNLLKLIAESDVNEVELEEGNFKIRIKKEPDTILREGSAPVYMGHPQAMEFQAGSTQPVPKVAQPPSAAPQAKPTTGEAKTDEKFITVRSPIVGTFYRAASPEMEPFVNVGDTITQGNVLCIVEAMKIMNEIESEHSGKIVEILAENG